MFRATDELVDVLFKYLEFSTDEKLVAGVGQKVLSALKNVFEAHIDVSKLPGALEDLSTAFESYLKKVAVIKAKNDLIKLLGDGVAYLGLVHTPLGGLLEGKVAKSNPRNNSIPTLLAPIVTFLVF